MATKTKRTGRPTKFGHKMPKTSLTLPAHLMEALERARKESGFTSIADQIRFELMKPRGMWIDITPVLPTQQTPGQNKK